MTASATTANDADNAGWRTALSRDEIDQLLAMEDWRSWLSIGVNWGLSLGAMALVAAWPNPLTVIFALFVIGARQLGLAVLMHEASHRSLFSDRRVNDWAGSWLCAYPVWSDLHAYRPYHLQHHAHTGGEKDPDLGLIRPFPITGPSLRRKVWRDLSGQTGIKFAKAAWKRSVGKDTDPARRKAFHGMLITNAALIAVLTLFGHPELWLLWAAAWLTTNTLVTRIRSIAEHALTPDPNDPLGNTRTTIPSWWERLLIAPNFVNYHLEHHLLMTVPHYKLPRMHAMLCERGLLERACLAHSYLEILRNAASKPATDGPVDPETDETLGHRYPPF